MFYLAVILQIMFVILAAVIIVVIGFLAHKYFIAKRGSKPKDYRQPIPGHKYHYKNVISKDQD
jgi:CDP-diglyceride synthetase